MINFNACVIEIASNCYRVIIEDVRATVIDTEYEYALASIIESMLSCDYDYVEVARGLTDRGADGIVSMMFRLMPVMIDMFGLKRD